jgi:DMSO/TMAO reductase YedYZ molybdopterin-dependent catalytic subunit
LLSDVLAQVRPSADGVDVRFEGADHGAYHLKPILSDTDKDDLTFVRALPFAHAADPAAEILVAYEMNGEPLSPDHGAPFRLIVPHWYAVASVKWLSRIDVLTAPYTGEFQTGHYMYQWPDREDEAVRLMRVRARITEPLPGTTIERGRCMVQGRAWSGTGPVTRVEVSFTGEGDWHQAELEAPGGPYEWQHWSFAWEATDVGRHTLRARATDGERSASSQPPRRSSKVRSDRAAGLGDGAEVTWRCSAHH